MNTNGAITCRVCNKQILGGQKTLETHFAGKKHVNQLPIFITVKGPFSADKVIDINNYFGQFGTIVRHVPTVTENSVSIDYFFLDKKDYTKIIHSEHTIDGKNIEISWIKPNSVPKKVEKVLVECKVTRAKPVSSPKQPTQQKNQAKTNKMANSEESRVAILNSVKEGKTFEEQVDLLLQKLKGDPDEIEKNRRIIYNDLTGALSTMFPHHQIHFFGSSITGLDYKGSDLDVYVANVGQRTKPEVMILKTLRMLIYRSKKFCDLLLISGATVPIIKCIHTRTQICCDLNIRNSLPVTNSELIKYYLSLNEKIKQLMIVVKFWAECYSLKRANFLSGYAIYLLVIFYLQQEPYNLPSVVELQKNIPPNFEDGWNCAFEKLNYTDSVLKEMSLMELVAGFFKFYSHFDYISQVVCPFLGKPIRKTCFIKPYQLPNCFTYYMKQDKDLHVNSGICIQDPFEHNRNVSIAMPLMFVGKFAVLCAHIAQEILNCEVELLLYNVLTKFSKVALNVYHFMLENFQSSDDEAENLATFGSVKELTQKILEKVVCCQVTVDPKSKEDQVIFSCASKHNIWDNRMNILNNLQMQLPSATKEIDREVAATACIVKYFPQSLVANFTVTITLKKNPFSVEFIMQTSGKTKSFFHICHFLKMKVNEWFMEDKNGVEVSCDNNKETTDIVKEEPLTTDSKDTNEDTSSNGIQKAAEDANLTSKENDVHEDMVKKEEETQSDNNVGTNNSLNTQNDNADEGLQEVPSNGDQVALDSAVAGAETKQVSDNDSKQMSADKPKSVEEGEVADEEEDEEDIPPDFFDDFSNQDFMDGLDIVDAWDEESGKPLEAEGEKDNANSKKGERKVISPIRFSSKESHGKSSESRSKRTADKYDRSKSRSPVRHSKRSNSYSRRQRSKSRSREKVRLSDIRRDPEKTKRDINKDKIKCARDKEQKLVSDKLRLVETGLVPPGTEMDVDISSIMREKRRSEGASVERLKEERERKYLKRSGSRETRKPRYSRSPPVYRSKVRDNRVDSSYRSRRRTPSIDSNASERELWMRSNRKRTHSRSRSRSRDPLRLKSSRKYEDKKKKTFLEEIRDKLNEVRSVPVVQYPHPNMPSFPNPMQPPHSMPAPHPMPVPHPIPAPVPAPNQFFNQNNSGMQQYDQSFFIGDSYSLGPSNNVMLNQPQPINYNNMMGGSSTGIVVSQVQMSQIAQMQPIQTTPKLPVVQQTANVSPKVSILNEPTLKPTDQNDKQTTDDIDKLFADKKISLSDFLTITAKCEVQSSSPEHLQKKIKVISRCQDAIKAMSDDRKFTGRLSVKPSLEPKNKSEVKYQSPLRRIPVVRFQFTTPSKVSEEADTFGAALDKILQKIGVLKESVNLEDLLEVVGKTAPGSSFADEDTTALTLKASLLNSKASIDSVGCEECKKRKLKTFADVGSQCADAKEMVCVGTQVNEEELSPSKGLLKNDSIAYLTPAQLLEKEKEKEAPSSSVVNAKVEEKKIEESETAAENKKEKPKPTPPPKTRGGFRKSLRDRQYNNLFNHDEFYDRGRIDYEYEDPREGFGPRFGPGMPPIRYPRHPLDTNQPNLLRMNQLRDEDGGLFMDFTQPYRGRNPRFGPRY